MNKIVFNSPNPYTVIIENDLSAAGEAFAKFFAGAKRVAIITDERVYSLYGKLPSTFLNSFETFYFVLKGGEKDKSFDAYLEIIKFLSDSGISREDAVLAFGGGVVGDIAAFAASTYLRGIKYAALPTTVLSMVDSCVGGKTAIDVGLKKNVVGTFYSPCGVYINSAFYKTLPKEELSSGWGELVKYALISGDLSAEEFKNKEFNAETVAWALDIKRIIVEEDPFDVGVRHKLNLGHTFGHAIESLSAFTLPHGDCVVKGIYQSLLFSKKHLGLDNKSFEIIFELLTAKGHDPLCPFDAAALKEYIKADKKSDGENIKFVTFDKDSKVIVCPTTVDELFN